MFDIPDAAIRLRKFEVSDVDSLWSMRNDVEVVAGLVGFSTGYSHSDIENWIEFHRSKSDEVMYAIADSSTDICVGHVALYQVDHRSQKAEFGILIGDADYRGKGYGEKVTRFIVNFGFDRLNLNKVTLTVLKTNAKAAALYEKLGFVHEGVSREDTWRDGSFVDVVMMSVLRREWDGGHA